MRQLIHRVTIADCTVQTFRAGGKGGQNQNKRDTGVRIIHRPSGAVGEARDERSQLQNKKLAFRRMAYSPVFQSWLRSQTAEDHSDIPAPSSSRRIRTYNLVERWVKDHRTNRMSHDIAGVLDGDLDQLR